MRALKYTEARAQVNRALDAGGHDFSETVAFYAMAAELAGILDGPEACEREFRKVLTLDPHRAPPNRDSPVFRVPYERAVAWVRAGGHIELGVIDANSELTVRITSDPLAL